MKGRASILIVAAVASIGVLTAASGTIGASSTAAFAMGVPTIVDPIRGGAEPYVVVDNDSNPIVAAPGGTSVQTSFFWRSTDGGQTYTTMGPTNGHYLCASGGGDSALAYDRVTGDLYLTDQQGLVSFATGKLTADGQLTSACFSTPAMSADRPFTAILHPTGTRVAPQVKENGGKPIVYLSWGCPACVGNNVSQFANAEGGGLAHAWSDDGTHWHAADPGVPADTLVTDQFYEAPAIASFSGHGTTVVDQESGYVYTALSCSTGFCPNGSGKNELGVVVAKPGADRADPSNIGQFASEIYRTVADKVNGQAMPEQASLFPVLTEDRAGTLYLVWVQGEGNPDDLNTAPPATSWHVYYSYSTDRPDHKTWSAPIRVDRGPASATAIMPWAAAGDPGKLAVTWLATNVREHPSKTGNRKPWHPFVAISTNAATNNATFQQDRIGVNPNHIGDICLQGLNCSTEIPNGNRNLADFISIDVAPDGTAIATWASDANEIGTLPTSSAPGVPITMTSRQISGPRLIGSGSFFDNRFSASAASVATDRTGDAQVGEASERNLDLTGTQLSLEGSDVRVRIPVSTLASLGSPDGERPNVWWLTVWQFHNKLYFAKAESVDGGEPTFTAGIPASYDRPGLGIGTFPTLVDYRGGTQVQGTKQGDSWVITLPGNLVGDPKTGDLFETVTTFTVLDNGLQPFSTAALANLPMVVDATPTFDAVLGALPTVPAKPKVLSRKTARGGSLPATGVGDDPAIALALLAGSAVLYAWHRRRLAS